MMKKKTLKLMLVGLLTSSLLFSSCIGSFGLFNKLLSWNKTIDSKFVNELVFIAFWIVPIYEISLLADIVVINSIEFWSGSNPVADVGTIKKVETPEGLYAIETTTNGYHIQKEGSDDALNLIFDEMDQSWSYDYEGEVAKLFKFASDEEVIMYLPNGEEMNVELNQAGLLAFKEIASKTAYFAAR